MVELTPIERRVMEIAYVFFVNGEEGELTEERLERKHRIPAVEAAAAMRTLAAKKMLLVQVPVAGELWTITDLTDQGERYMSAETEAD